MKKDKFGWAFILLTASVLLMYFSPDVLTLAFVGGMVLITAYGFFAGIVKTLRFGEGFRRAQRTIDNACQVETDSVWNVVKETEVFFGNDLLDEEFHDYTAKVRSCSENMGAILYPIESQINEELLELHASDHSVAQISGILTSLGILGTFIGLILGLNNVTFTSINTAIVTIETMLDGVHVAFYTSISGVILSVLFNWCYNRAWQKMLMQQKIFIRDFHKYVLPSAQEQFRQLETEYYQEMLSLMRSVSLKYEQSEDDVRWKNDILNALNTLIIQSKENHSASADEQWRNQLLQCMDKEFAANQVRMDQIVAAMTRNTSSEDTSLVLQALQGLAAAEEKQTAQIVNAIADIAEKHSVAQTTEAEWKDTLSLFLQESFSEEQMNQVKVMQKLDAVLQDQQMSYQSQGEGQRKMMLAFQEMESKLIHSREQSVASKPVERLVRAMAEKIVRDGSEAK